MIFECRTRDTTTVNPDLESMVQVDEAHAIEPGKMQIETRMDDDAFWMEIAKMKHRGILLCRDRKGRIYQAKSIEEYMEYRTKVKEGKRPGMGPYMGIEVG